MSSCLECRLSYIEHLVVPWMPFVLPGTENVGGLTLSILLFCECRLSYLVLKMSVVLHWAFCCHVNAVCLTWYIGNVIVLRVSVASHWAFCCPQSFESRLSYLVHWECHCPESVGCLTLSILLSPGCRLSYLVHWECHCTESVNRLTKRMSFSYPVLRIRIHRIRMVLGLLDLDRDLLVRGTDPDLDPSIIKQK